MEKNRYFFGKYGIEAVAQIHAIQIAEIKMRHIIRSINPRISAPTADYGKGRLTQQGTHSLFYAPLYSTGIRLYLPPAKHRSVITEIHPVPHSAKILNKQKNQLGNDDAGEHGEGIDGRICNGGIVIWNSVRSIVQSHRVCHTAAEHTADRTEIEF